MFKKIAKHVAEAALFGAFVVGLGVLVCGTAGISIVWSPLLGPVALAGLLAVAEQF